MKMVGLSLHFCIIFFDSSWSQNLLLADSVIQKAICADGLDEQTRYFQKFSNYSVDGKYYSEGILKNKITLLNFWFEACAPCIAEFKSLAKLYGRFKTNPNFQFLSFTFEKKENAWQLVDRYRLPYPVIAVEKESAYSLIFKLGFPTTMVTDRTGMIRYIKCGGPEDEPSIIKMVNSLYSKKILVLLSEK